LYPFEIKQNSRIHSYILLIDLIAIISINTNFSTLSFSTGKESSIYHEKYSAKALLTPVGGTAPSVVVDKCGEKGPGDLSARYTLVLSATRAGVVLSGAAGKFSRYVYI
jgi:hypothetical protein